MNLYLHSAGLLSGSSVLNGTEITGQMPQYETDRLLCKEPDYSAYIKPMQLRRMSKAVRMGVGAARICLQSAGRERAEAISVGTAFGCLEDTELFLSKMVEQQEQTLSPTPFIQSTHNTVAGQIALLTGCMGHNLTYVHRGHSFEHAMLNAQLYLDNNPGAGILVGGIEELTHTSLEVLKRNGVYRSFNATADSILHEAHPGSLAGEGAGFFYVTSSPASGLVCVRDILTFNTRDCNTALKKVEVFLQSLHVTADDIDLLVLGVNGDNHTDTFYKTVGQSMFDTVSQAAFKHLCGEYPVSSSFALAMIRQAAGSGIPPAAVLNFEPRQLQRILLINNFVNHYSCWYLEVH